MSISKKIQLICSIALSFISLMYTPFVMAQSLTASIDRNEISIVDSFTLKLQANDISTLSQPDLSVLNNDFVILGKNVSQSMQNINGVSSQSIVWQLQLQAKHLGEVTIPSFSLEGFNSQQLQLKVSEAVTNPTDEADFKLQLLSNKSEVKVNEQVIVTLKLLFAKNVSNLQNSELKIENAKVLRLEDKSYETTIDGRNFGVYEISYAVFAHGAGNLQIPAQNVVVRIGRSSVFNNRQGKTVALQTKPIQLPVSDNAQGNNVLVADSLTLAEKWSAKSEEISLGDSITREVVLQVHGALAQTIPPLAMADIDGIKVYPEAADKTEQKTSSGVVTSRSRKFAIVPTKAGTYLLPAIEISWWNTRAKQYQVATIAKKKIVVLAPINVPVAPSTTKLEATNKPALTEIKLEKVIVEKPLNLWLLWSNLVSLLVVILLSILLYKARKINKPASATGPKVLEKSADEAKLFTELMSELSADDETSFSTRKLHQALQSWAKCMAITQWPSTDLQNNAEQLQRQLYAKKPLVMNWQKDAFKQQLKALRKELQANRKAALVVEKQYYSADLYPTSAKVI
ncbi:MAG: BatD family protein [Oceanospirillaceae bacterium]